MPTSDLQAAPPKLHARIPLLAALGCMVFGLAMLATLLGLDRCGAFVDPNWGTLKGRIVWGEDEVPRPRDVQTNGRSGMPPVIAIHDWVIHPENKGIRWVFVWLEPSDPAKALEQMPIHPDLVPIKPKRVLLSEKNCRYEPAALALREGQVLDVFNADPFAHSFNCRGHPLTNPGQHIISPPGARSATLQELRADQRYPLVGSCNIHGWMQIYVRVFSHPYFALTDADGIFEIKLAPLGDWRLMIWSHEGYIGGAKGKNGRPVRVVGGKTIDLGDIEWPRVPSD